MAPTLTIAAQIAVYPLRQERLKPTIEKVTSALRAHGIAPEVGPLSTQIVGEVDTVFAALREAFVGAAASGPVVMTVTLSNACPVAR
jgi:uncharacterized protein YqgV (UPF0045/DUF77 family)